MSAGSEEMLFFHRSLRRRHYLVAGVLAVIVPMGIGYVIFRADPSACYDSPCALPLLLLTVPPYAAPALAALFAINRRRQKPVPDGWLPTVLLSGLIGQIAISALSVMLASPNIRRNFFLDVLFVPQGLFVCLAVGAVFWIALHVCGRESAVI